MLIAASAATTTATIRAYSIMLCPSLPVNLFLILLAIALLRYLPRRVLEKSP
jgi:hypothetical protein